MKKNMPVIIGGVVVVVVFAALVFLITSNGKASQSSSVKSEAAQTVQLAPDFLAKDVMTSKDVSLKMYTNQVILLNFWATWCPPCRMEIPDLVNLYKKYKGKFVVIGVSVDRDGPEVVRKFYKENKMNFPVIMATSELVNAYGGISAIPTSFLIDRSGKVVQTIVGYRNEAQYEEMIKANL